MAERIAVDTNAGTFKPKVYPDGDNPIDRDTIELMSHEIKKVANKIKRETEGHHYPKGSTTLYIFDEDFQSIFWNDGRQQSSVAHDEPDLEIEKLRMKPPEKHQGAWTMIFDYDTGNSSINKALDFQRPLYRVIVAMLDFYEVDHRLEHNVRHQVPKGDTES